MDDQLSLTVAMVKTKVLASRIDHGELLNWVNAELKGYPDRDSLPPYRITSGVIVGDMLKQGNMITDFPLPIPDLGVELDKKIRLFRLTDNLTTLERFLKNDKGNAYLTALFPDHILRVLEGPMKNVNGPSFQLLRAGVKVPLHFVNQVLAEVKDKLLEFILALDKQFGINTEINDLKNKQSIINQIMSTTIHNNGDGNVINTGEKTTVTANITINKGNKQVLERTLSENKVAEEDIQELLLVIDEEPPKDQKFGVKVNTWMGKMYAKALSGGWEISAGAAGSILAQAIMKYYGLV